MFDKVRSWVIIETISVILCVLSFFSIFRFGYDFSAKNLFFFIDFSFLNIVFFVSCLVIFLLVHFLILSHYSESVKIKNDAIYNIKKVAKDKLSSAKHKESVVLILSEFVFSVVVAFSIYFYLDPEINIIPFPWNFIFFIGFVIVSLYLFSYTYDFRSSKKLNKPIGKRK